MLSAILWLDTFAREIGCAPGRAERTEALALAKSLVASGHDKNLSPLLRGFVFLPFMHSDELIDRECAVALFAGLRRETQQEMFELAYAAAVRQRDALLATRPEHIRTDRHSPTSGQDPENPTCPDPRG